jgi:hypothetical protein
MHSKAIQTCMTASTDATWQALAGVLRFMSCIQKLSWRYST